MQGDRFGKKMGYLPNSKLAKPIFLYFQSILLHQMFVSSGSIITKYSSISCFLAVLNMWILLGRRLGWEEH